MDLNSNQYKGPLPNCCLCPRLFKYREVNRAKNPSWHNNPVPPFGTLDGGLLIVGMAPGLKGANLTGRPFTGDYAGDLLFTTLVKFGWANGTYGRCADDGICLIDCRLTNAVRCVPPQNKPTGPEVSACAPFLADEIGSMSQLRCILTLGGLAHGAVVSTLGFRKSAWKFGHNKRHDLPGGPVLFSSYHCSRYNTNTGRLTKKMFEDVFRNLKGYFD